MIFGTSVYELKRAIVEKKKLGHGADFDLRFKHAQTDEGKTNKSAALFSTKQPNKRRSTTFVSLVWRSVLA